MNILKFNYYFIFLNCYKNSNYNKQKNSSNMPIIQWNFANNATHGVIEVMLSNLAMFDSFQINGIYAQTFTKKRYE